MNLLTGSKRSCIYLKAKFSNEMRPLSSQSLKAMKLTFILLTITFLQISAKGVSQNVTLSVKDVTLDKVFRAIEKQTGYGFLYSRKMLDEAPRITLDVKNQSVDKVLQSCFKDNLLKYSIENNTIIITKRSGVEIKPAVQSVFNAPPPPVIISGLVTNKDGDALAGVSVIVKESNKGAATNQDGKYSITMNENEKVLVFSFIGMKKQEIVVGNRKIVNVTMETETSREDEIVVVGYGTSKAKDLTGSVSRITAEDLEGAPPHTDIAAMLQGKAAGVNVMINNGAPGAAVAIQIRGTTSLTGNNQPLWVVDGIPQYNVSGSDIATVLYDFNISDVESIDILKDASATAIYGSRAANGVIIVTTKKGKANMKPQIDFSYNLGIQAQTGGFRMLNTEEYKSVITNAMRNYFATTGTAPTTGALSTLLDPKAITPGMEIDYLSAPFKSDAFFNGSNNWWNEMTQHAMESKYDISLRGGTPVTNYYLSIGISDQEGIVKGSDRNGITGRFNFDTRVATGLKAGINMNGSYYKLNNKDAMVDKIWNFRPDYPMYDNDGKYFDPGANQENPMISLLNRNLTEGKGFNGTGFLEYKPINDLLLRSNISISHNETMGDLFYRKGTVNTTHDGQANLSVRNSSNWVFENTATYSKTFGGKHGIVALGGFAMERGAYKTFDAGAQNFPDQDIMTNITSGTIPLKPRSSYTSSALASVLSRINYKYDDRFLATFTFRADGSSRFGPDKRWGYFPSGAVAWIVSNENFMKNSLSTINYLKLRTSYGKSGSQVLGNDDWRTLYGSGQYEGQPGMIPSQLGNAELMWEQTLSFDIGIDYALLKDRLRGTIGAYNKDTRDIIYTRGIPASSAFTTVKQNVATIRNQGVEFDISYDFIKKKDLTFSVGFNISQNLAKCIEINGRDSMIEIYAGNALAMRIKQGEPLSQWIGYEWSGRYYQSMEEYNLLATQNPANGAKIWYQNGLSSIRPGDLRFNDTNGDGLINNDDRVALGSAQPKLFGGFSPSFRYKGISIQTNFSFSYGATRYWYTNSANWYSTGLFLKNYPAYVLDSWSEDNRTAAWPRMAYGQGSSNTFSDFWLSKADYLRMNLLRVNYRLPKNLINLKALNSIDLSFSTNNLFTITNYKGIDPQGNFNLRSGGIAGIGTDYGTYPAMRSYNFSAKISLK